LGIRIYNFYTGLPQQNGEMMSRPLNLYRLQQVDTKIDQANARLKEIEALLSDDANLRKAKALASRAEKNLEAAEKEQRQAETKVKDQRIKIEQTEATLYGGTVRNPKELQDLQNEVAALKRFLDTLEERQLETMLATDEATEENEKAQNILGQYQAQAEKKQASLVQERTQLTSQKAATEKQRQGAAKNIAPDDLAIYERLRKQRAGVAVSGVKDRACAACGSTLTAALHQAARSPSQLVFCDLCGRILYAS
jgi:predicted  nucleic acid-binding Zn-ribbon protein